TFWLTAEWNGGSSWSTRIGSFQLEQCPSPNCPNPSGLATSSIGNNTATLSWSSVTGADNFDIYYKLSTSSTWTLAANGNTSRTVNLTGLTQLSSYDWQVRANCPAGNGNYVKASFITSGPCAAPSGLSTSALTVNSVILNWNAVQGASNYTVEYKLSTASTWTSATVSTNYLSVSSLQPNTAYSWRVAANCTGSSSSAATASFTTPNFCNSNLDNTTNDATSGAAVIPFGTDVKGLINTTTDKDFYKFTITTGGTISLGLTTLPFDYDLRLYRGKNQVAISQNAGTANEGINYTARADTYYAQVYGYSGANSVTQCYTLRVNLGTAKAPEIAAAISSASTIKDGYSIKVYPNPVDQLLEVAFSGIAGPVGIRIVDLSGRVLQQKTAANGLAELNLGSLKSGIYLVKVLNMKGDILHYSKFIKQ
ncbi:MAG: fibronectin type III domain-containing protein, partial [Chitinophagaceae bacterium]